MPTEHRPKVRVVALDGLDLRPAMGKADRRAFSAAR